MSRINIFSILVLTILFKIIQADLEENQNSENDSSNFPFTQQVTKTKVIFCDYNFQNSRFETNKKCQKNSYSFTFLAHFHNRNFLGTKNLKRLAQLLSEYSLCEVKYMKYNQDNKSLDYFNLGDKSYWYQDKKLNNTYSPEVFIIKEDNDKKKIVFKCPIPVSDVYLSLNGDEKRYKSSQSHPLPNFRVSVSAIHVKLNFMKMESLNINLKKSTNEEYSIINNPFDISNEDILPKRSTERYLVHFDTRCRDCTLGESTSKFAPYIVNSLNCNLKPNSCEYEGSCLKDREIYSPLKFDSEDDKPTLNSFICLSNYSQTSLYMPCAIKNGNCSYNQKCSFEARTLDVKCENFN